MKGRAAGELRELRVAVVEDDTESRDYLFALLKGSAALHGVGAWKSVAEAAQNLGQAQPNVLLFDLRLPDGGGPECIRQFRERWPSMEIVVLSVEDDPKEIFSALKAGATGYLTKPSTSVEIVEAVHEAGRGGAPMSSAIARLVIEQFHARGKAEQGWSELTQRERQVLELVARGCTNKEVAKELATSSSTVGTHLHSIYQKLQVNCRTEAAAKYWER